MNSAGNSLAVIVVLDVDEVLGWRTSGIVRTRTAVPVTETPMKIIPFLAALTLAAVPVLVATTADAAPHGKRHRAGHMRMMKRLPGTAATPKQERNAPASSRSCLSTAGSSCGRQAVTNNSR